MAALSRPVVENNNILETASLQVHLRHTQYRHVFERGHHHGIIRAQSLLQHLQGANIQLPGLVILALGSDDTKNTGGQGEQDWQEC